MLSHHAYYIEDALSQAHALSEHIRVSEGFEQNDPNFIVQHFDKFGIDESRLLIELTSLKNTGARALFFISLGSITSEAQQALLKLFEEPQEGTVFVLLVPHGTLLPTLRSRFLTWSEGTFTRLPAQTENHAKAFISWPYKKRSDWIASLLKEEEDGREKVRGFLSDLEGELYTSMHQGREVREALAEIAHFRQYLTDKAPSLKMILEHFAATLPKFD